MPYVITTVSPPPPPNHSRSGNVIVCRAAGTVEQARSDVANLAVDHGRPVPGVLVAVARSIAGDGGKIGPLPDGATIEVHRVTWEELATETADWTDGDLDGMTWEEAQPLILAAYNAKCSGESPSQQETTP